MSLWHSGIHMSYTVDLLSRCLLADVDSSRYHVKKKPWRMQMVCFNWPSRGGVLGDRCGMTDGIAKIAPSWTRLWCPGRSLSSHGYKLNLNFDVFTCGIHVGIHTMNGWMLHIIPDHKAFWQRIYLLCYPRGMCQVETCAIQWLVNVRLGMTIGKHQRVHR